MSFNWAAFAKIAELVGPIVMQASGVPPAVIPLVVHGIQVAEVAGSGGADKKAVAMDAVQTGLAAVNAARPGTVDVDQLTVVVSNGIDETIAAIKAAKNIPLAPGPAVVIGGKS